MIQAKTRGIYIHIPFCKSKCPYCDFYSMPGASEENIESFAAALEAEIRYYGGIYGRAAELRNAVTAAEAADDTSLRAAAAKEPELAAALPIDSIYFGGGTPSLLSEKQFERIICCIRDEFDICGDVEISMEANPATVTAEKLAACKSAGLNRLSIGAQSFDPAVLKLLGRLHKPEHTAEAVEAARKVGIDNISIDLMFGIDGQSEGSWEKSVRRAIELEPEHISLYTLEIMDGTRFARDLEKGIYRQTDEETDRRMYAKALDMMENCGIMQYEISNACLPGYECRHNMRYWSMGEYLGFGPSAHSFVCGTRYANCADTKRYIAEMTSLGEKLRAGGSRYPSEYGRVAAAVGTEPLTAVHSPSSETLTNAPPEPPFDTASCGSLQPVPVDVAACRSETAVPSVDSAACVNEPATLPLGTAMHGSLQPAPAKASPAARPYLTPVAEEFYRNTVQDDMAEYMFTGLRRNAGISKADFRMNFGAELWECFAEAKKEFDEFAEGGFAYEDADRIRLTRSGMNISNRIMLLFV